MFILNMANILSRLLQNLGRRKNLFSINIYAHLLYSDKTVIQTVDVRDNLIILIAKITAHTLH